MNAWEKSIPMTSLNSLANSKVDLPTEQPMSSALLVAVPCVNDNNGEGHLKVSAHLVLHAESGTAAWELQGVLGNAREGDVLIRRCVVKPEVQIDH